MESVVARAHACLALMLFARRAETLATAAAVLALFIASSVSAHYFISVSAVSERRIAYVEHTKYDDARRHAVDAWNALREVTIAPAAGGEVVDLKWADVYQSDVYWWGFYNSYSGTDLIRLNTYWLDKSYAGLTTEKGVAGYELGHALGLWHNPDSTQLMNTCPACADGSLATTPQVHDKADYYERWPKVAPTVAITAPAAGALVRGSVTITAKGTDDVKIDRVEFYIGTTLIVTDRDGSNGYKAAWNTAAIGNGAKSITVKAYDTSSNMGRASRSVTVDNTMPVMGVVAQSLVMHLSV